jgi:hypothetical protein
MIEHRTRILVCLLVLLAAVPGAIPQTAQSGPPTRQAALRKTGKSGTNGSSPATGANPGALPGLCFQPGVGWQRILLPPPSVPATPGTHGNAPSVDVRLSSARSSSTQQVAECAGNSINKKAIGAGVDVERLTILNRPQTTGSAGPAKSGTATSLHVNSPYNAHGSTSLEPVGIAPAPTYFVSEAEPDAHPDHVGVRAFHAYTSSIKLRRLIRNTPDFRTRIRLQQLQNSPAAQLHKARAATKTGAARRPLQGERANRASSPGSDTHGRPRENARNLFSSVYR